LNYLTFKSFQYDVANEDYSKRVVGTN